MHDYRDETITKNPGPNWPAIADPMVLLDELERRLDHCEIVVSNQLDDIQHRLGMLETDVQSLRAELVDSRAVNEKQVMELANRLTRLEDRNL